MARTRRSPPGTRRGGDGVTAQTGSDVGPLIAGVNRSEIQDNPDRYLGEIYKGAHFESLNIPETAVAGGEVTISGVVHFDSPHTVITTVGMRVVVDSPSLNEPITEEYSNIQHCNSRAFSIKVPVPDSPGSQLAVTVKGQSTSLTGGWQDGAVRGGNRIDILTEDGVRKQQIQDYIPWAVAGAGMGVGTNQQLEYTDNTRAAVSGAVLGAGSKLLWDSTGPIGFDFDVPTTEIAVIGGSALAVTLLLERTGVASVLGATGDVAGTAIETTKGAVDGRLPGGGK